MRVRIGVVCAALAGCSFQPVSATSGDDGPHGDTIVLHDVATACSSWHSTHFDACMIPAPPGDVHVTTGSPLTYDTTTGTLTDSSHATIAITSADYTQSGGVHASVWSIANLTIDSGIEIDVIGPKPLIVAAWGSLIVDGTIDAGSYAGGRTGGGANPDACSSHASGNGADGTSGTGGGGGGGFGGNGAAGGIGDGNCTPLPTCEKAGGVRGADVTAPPNVIGGCGGGASGASGQTSAPGGAGGGGVLLAAQTSLRVSGSLLAGGAGGSGDTSNAVSTGGGGGGAGGFLGLEAPAIDVGNATIAANGGGGGGGADIAGFGNPGQDGMAGTSAALGGSYTSGGTTGGNGSSSTSGDGGGVNGALPNGGGGGGGGGAGFVRTWATTFSSTNATICPAASAGT